MHRKKFKNLASKLAEQHLFLYVLILMVLSFTTIGDVMSESNATPKILFVAGNMNGPGYLDGPVAFARLNRPEGVVIDKAGNLFVTDTSNHVIRKITPEGVVSTFAGKWGNTGTSDGKGGEARFNSPHGIAIDSDDQLYVVDRFNYAVRKISVDGVVSTIAGAKEPSRSEDGVGASAKFGNPDGIAIDLKHNIYVTDGNAVRKITPAGLVTTLAGIPEKTGREDGVGSAARFIGTNGIATDKAGNVYVGDSDAIRKITPSGEVTTLVGKKDQRHQDTNSAARLDYLEGLTMDSTENLYVTDHQHTIHKVSLTGEVTLIAGVPGKEGLRDGPNKLAQFEYPHGLTIDKAGAIYIADSRNNAIRKLTPAGNVVTLVGSRETNEIFDDVGAAAHFNKPTTIAADKTGNLYVVDDESLLRKITPASAVTTFSKGDWNAINRGETGFGLKHSGFSTVRGLTTDRDNNVYVTNCRSRQHVGGGGYSMLPPFLRSDSVEDDKIQKVSPSGEVTTIKISKGKVGYLQGIVTDDDGNMYVADNEKYVIFKVTPKKYFSASVTVFAGKEDARGVEDGVGGEARFIQPSDMVRDNAGNIYVLDGLRIRKITPEGKVTTLAGEAEDSHVVDGVGTVARFENPKGIAVDNHGNVYVAEYFEHVIRKITPAGVVSTFVGQKNTKGFVHGALPGVLVHPSGVTVHGNDLYITMQHGIVVVRNLP